MDGSKGVTGFVGNDLPFCGSLCHHIGTTDDFSRAIRYIVHAELAKP